MASSTSEQLVIFGCGYVGAAVARQAIARGWRVTALTRNRETAAGLEALGARTVVAELASREWHDRIPGAPAFVLNTVSAGGGGVAGYRRSYVDGMRSVLEWARAFGRIGTLVYTSSTSVYPQGGGAVVDETMSHDGVDERGALLLEAETLLRENVVGDSGGGDSSAAAVAPSLGDGVKIPTKPDSVILSAAKNPSAFPPSMTWILRCAQNDRRSSDLLSAGIPPLTQRATRPFERCFILRLGGIYGPGRHYLLDQVRAGTVAGIGTHRLNLAHRDDICRAIWAAFEAPREICGGVFNVADDHPAPKAEVVQWLATRLGIPVPVFSGLPAGTRRAVTPDRIISNARLKHTLGWHSLFPDYRTGYEQILATQES